MDKISGAATIKRAVKQRIESWLNAILVYAEKKWFDKDLLGPLNDSIESLMRISDFELYAIDCIKILGNADIIILEMIEQLNTNHTIPELNKDTYRVLLLCLQTNMKELKNNLKKFKLTSLIHKLRRLVALKL